MNGPCSGHFYNFVRLLRSRSAVAADMKRRQLGKNSFKTTWRVRTKLCRHFNWLLIFRIKPDCLCCKIWQSHLQKIAKITWPFRLNWVIWSLNYLFLNHFSWFWPLTKITTIHENKIIIVTWNKMQKYYPLKLHRHYENRLVDLGLSSSSIVSIQPYARRGHFMMAEGRKLNIQIKV